MKINLNPGIIQAGYWEMHYFYGYENIIIKTAIVLIILVPS